MLIGEIDRIIESENTWAYITEGERKQKVTAKTICLQLEEQGSMQSGLICTINRHTTYANTSSIVQVDTKILLY